jgi:RNA polymerase sigma-70 factor (ECF subfamily)
MSAVAAITVPWSPVDSAPPVEQAVDFDSRQWLRSLRAEGRERDDAVARLHALLLRAARFEVARRRPTLPHLRGNDLDDIAHQAADDALVSVLARLDSFRGASRFTTWAYKFALLEAAVKLRRRAWQGRELPLEPESWALFSSSGPVPEEEAEQSELLVALQRGIESALTERQERAARRVQPLGEHVDRHAVQRERNQHAPLTRRCMTRGGACADTSTSKASPPS